jgi:hypothetical protein
MKRIFLALISVAGLASVASPARAITDAALLDTLQHTAFQYFWEQGSSFNGLIRDRSKGDSPASTASMGFGLSAICIGIDHGYVSRADGATRVLTALQTLWNMPQGNSTSGTIGYKGLFWHWLDMSTATRTWNSELSTIDTALLFAGIMDARQYFTGDSGDEPLIRALADSITYRADWDFMRNGGPGLKMGFQPGATGFGGFGTWVGYNEAMILYIIALGSRTHPVPASDWDKWTSGYSYIGQYGYIYVNFPPLFGHQYSHCWIDFRGIRDSYMQARNTYGDPTLDYFENSRRATLAQRAYAIANPGLRVGYSANLWGLTASDVPTGYSARGAPPGQNDDGTITPTAPISSIPFAPTECLAVAHNLWDNYSTGLWGPYGFKDAFNLTSNPDWYDTDYLGIDQGPIIMMIENYRTNSVWNRFMKHPDIVRGMYYAGFTPGFAGVPSPSAPAAVELLESTPNPFRDETTLRFRLPRADHVRLSLYDVSGRERVTLVDGVRGAGEHTAVLEGHGLPAGIYLVSLQSGGTQRVGKCVLVR